MSAALNGYGVVTTRRGWRAASARNSSPSRRVFAGAADAARLVQPGDPHAGPEAKAMGAIAVRDPDDLVTRHRAVRTRRADPLGKVQVGTADRAHAHADENLRRPRLRNGQRGLDQRPLAEPRWPVHHPGPHRARYEFVRRSVLWRHERCGERGLLTHLRIDRQVVGAAGRGMWPGARCRRTRRAKVPGGLVRSPWAWPGRRGRLPVRGAP